MVARGNVVVVSEDGRRLTTEELIYNQQKNQISSDSAFVLTETDRRLEGIGFRSDPNMKNIQILKGASGFARGVVDPDADRAPGARASRTVIGTVDGAAGTDSTRVILDATGQQALKSLLLFPAVMALAFASSAAAQDLPRSCDLELRTRIGPISERNHRRGWKSHDLSRPRGGLPLHWSGQYSHRRQRRVLRGRGKAVPGRQRSLHRAPRQSRLADDDVLSERQPSSR